MPELMSPTQVARALGVSETDVLSIIESGELKAKKIGSSYRIKRLAVDAYLSD
jgi:excisionase family DNA binding protein